MYRTFILVVICLSFASLANAGDEAVLGRITGNVIDTNRAPIVGATVAAIRGGTTIRSETVTSEQGEFSFDLPRGTYVLTLAAKGFEQRIETIRLGSDTLSLEPLTLSVASATATVTVSDEAVYVAGNISTATKTFTSLRDIPQSISVIKREQIADQNATSIADVIRYVPGVSSHQGENNRDQLIIRGQSTSADFYRDGVRDDVQYYRDPYNMERFEALKGPNAMIFGRGGGGGVINRVTREAKFAPIRELTLTGGSYSDRRVTGDIGQALGKKVAFRLNGVYEGSRGFRRFITLEREGINPTFLFTPDSKTSINVGYEFFRDRRTADRGITSFQGRPANVPIETYYGDAKQTLVRANVNFFHASVERLFGDVIFRSRSQYGHYDRFYQNFVPGATNTAGTLVALTAYDNATKRDNLFNQTDLTYSVTMGRVRHTLVGGTEFGRQLTDNFRNTGFFNNTATSIQVAFSNPVTTVPVTWRQSATDADNHLELNLAAAFIQDQIAFSKYFQAIVGARYDHFGLTYHNNRNGETLSRVDRLVSPRLGLVVKPVTAVSLYGSYSVSFLPSSGDQFSSLTVVTQQVKPEKFTNYEGGLKWDIRRGLFLNAAIYRLDRTNTRATDPNDPTRIIQTGKQRTDGFEVSLSGSVTKDWSMTGGYSWQNARITSATTAAVAGKQVAQVPHNLFSLWNKYQLTSRLGAGLGLIYRTDAFVAVDNTIVLPGYLKADAAIFYNISEHWRL
ncbi:MAG TPA: TonB-dependent siderophore receptor [Pyrinomonadaceae bacterium]|jgi:catecholate siderophore receptor|nr:TonB-dependent siderophore receptor [Pyrinomonadaceae bacterium]